MHVPHDYVDAVIEVYRVLHACNIPGVVQCSSLQVDGAHYCLAARQSRRNHPLAKCKQTAPHSHSVRLLLTPVGANTRPQDLPEVLTFTQELLGTLGKLHKAGLVHRDICLANIIRHERWYLIDFEVAASVNSPIWWTCEALYLDPGTPWTAAMDLGMLEEALRKLPEESLWKELE
ncbi:hypothetical protein WJX73_005317 [Symbiochloris irregularis]|uniref:Protein kinase domain-containing protein n=1 Tax=Symbiochloris irregularis TaxID=706552 RepID=A0AAW1P3J8_9CHLO